MTERGEGWGREQTLDERVRRAAFAFLVDETQVRGNVLPRPILAEGFRFEGQRIPLMGPQGIFKPAILPEIPLSITTVPIVEGRARPYDDEVTPGGLIRYRFRGVDPQHRDNVGLRLAMERRVPLIYFWGVVRGEYMPSWPAFVVSEDRPSLSFQVAVDVNDAAWEIAGGAALAAEARRQYVTQLTLHRLHQEGFRKRVIQAYQERCAVCRLRHAELLDAAHILRDGHPRGEPILSNGLALCKLHHAAFDSDFLGIRPDLVIEIREDILREEDGPMLTHGLQGFQGQSIIVPRSHADRPSADFLAERYSDFRKAG